MSKRRINIWVRAHLKKIRTGQGTKKVLVRKHNRRVLKNFGSTFELTPVHRIPGKKTQLLRLREDIEENLGVPDISEERKEELQERLEEINQKLKRIQGMPPSEDVLGRRTSEIKLSLLERFKGTSSRRPQFVEEMNLPLKEVLPPIREEQRRRAREHSALKKAFDIIGEKEIEQAIEKERPRGTIISLEDLRKIRPGRKMLSSLKVSLALIDINDIDAIKEEASRGKKMIFIKDTHGREGLIVNKYGPNWWNKATKEDIERNLVF